MDEVIFLYANKVINEMKQKTNKKVEQGLQTKQKIIESAEFIFYENGATTTTLEKIAEDASVTRGAIYGHFKNKFELLEYIIDSAVYPSIDLFRNMISTEGAPSFSHLRSVLNELIVNVTTNPGLMRRLAILIHKCELTSQFDFLVKKRKMYRDEVLKIFNDYFDEMQLAGNKLPQKSSVLAAATHCYILGLIEDYVLYSSESKLLEDLDDLLSLLPWGRV